MSRILIVDDDPDILANLVDILGDLGYVTDIATSGEDALEVLATHCPDQQHCPYGLCLFDFKMPGIDGVELYEQVMARNPALRAILITAYPGDDGVQRAVEAGMWGVLQKPVDVSELLEIVQSAVG